MAVPAGPTEVRYTGNGVTTGFTIPFLLILPTDLDVFISGTEVTTGFTVTGAGAPTSTITFTTAPADGADVYLTLNVPFERLNDYQENGEFQAATVNRDFDRIWQALKQLNNTGGRSLMLGNSDVDGAGFYRAKGNGIRNLADPTEPQDAATMAWVSNYISDILETGQGPVNNAANVIYSYPDGTIGTVQDLADAIKGVNLIGFKAAGANAVARSLGARYRLEEKYRSYVIDYMTDEMVADWLAGTYAVDCRPAFVDAQNALPLDGGTVVMPGGTLGLYSEFTFRHGVSPEGTGPMYSTNGIDPGNTVIVPRHAGRSCFSFQGANGCEPRNFTIKSYPDVFPKTGTVLGRSAAASAGQHHFDNVSILGHYSVAGIYSVAAEDILFTKPYVWIFGGGAKYCFATGISDSLGVGGGLVASSNLHITMVHPFFINSATDANSSCMYFEGAQATGNVSVLGGYMIAFAGSYVHINLGDIDGLSPIGTWTFNINGERLSGGDPLYGFRITATGVQTLKGLSISGGRFDLLASGVTTHYDIIVPGNVILDNPHIVMPPPEAFPYATSQVNRSQIHGGVVSVGRVARWTALAFASGWSNSFGTPYAGAGWRIGSDNNVMLRGTVSGSAVGVIATLPVEARPFADLRFPVSAGVSPTTCRVRISAATGEITLTGSQVVEVDLSGINFNVSI